MAGEEAEKSAMNLFMQIDSFSWKFSFAATALFYVSFVFAKSFFLFFIACFSVAFVAMLLCMIIR